LRKISPAARPLEPIQEVVESDESDVIPLGA
jgi:hypothetical protein